MLQILASHNNDIRRLLEKGYALAEDSGYLVVRDIPFLGNQSCLKWGALVTKLVDIDGEQVMQDNHQVFFSGSPPHGLDGQPIPNLGDNPATLALGDACKDVIVTRIYSNKPTAAGKYDDFFHKIESYVGVISGPAMEKFSVHPYTFRSVDKSDSESMFKFRDTMTSRAEIGDLSSKLKDDVIAIIGAGGTGAYTLDFIAKTPVREIRIFDADPYYVHNAYRSPGKLDPQEFTKPKALVHSERYSSFRTGIVAHPEFIDASSAPCLDGVTFAFVCVDKGSSRKVIFDLLVSLKIPFIDVGMGMKRRDGLLNGTLRTTFYSIEQGSARIENGLASLGDAPDDIYKSNIQIGELNAMNAALAVIMFKQVRGFYFNQDAPFHTLFEIADLKIVGDAETNEN